MKNWLKKDLLKIALCLPLMLMFLLTGCSEKSPSNNVGTGTTTVLVGLGKSTAGKSTAGKISAGANNLNAVTDDAGELAGVTSVVLSVSAADMATVTTTLPLTGETVSLSIPAGSDRVFTASAYAGTSVTFTGSTTVTLIGGTSTRVSITLNAVVPDTTAPVVASTTPIAGATNVAIGNTVSVTFDEPMNPATITTTSFGLRYPDPFGVGGSFITVTGNVTYSSSTFTAIFMPTAALPGNTQITATLISLVTDVAGNPLSDTPYTFQFTTEAGSDTDTPHVDSTLPIDGGTGVALSSVVSVTFDEAMDSGTIDNTSFGLSYGSAINIPGAVSYNAFTFTATFTPSSNLPANTLITATLANTITDVAGNVLSASPYNFYFTTVTAPTVDPIQLVSIASDNTQGNQISIDPDISGDGRYVVFSSDATTLVAGDTNGSEDIFVRDVQSGITTRVSVATDGAQANNDSTKPYISSDGRYVVFSSSASNLVTADNNGNPDAFVHDRLTGITARASFADGGGESDAGGFAVAISDDGRYVLFSSDSATLVASPAAQDVFRNLFRYDRQTGTTVQVDVGNDGSHPVLVEQYGAYTGTYASMSADGRYVAFTARSGNLVSGDTNGSLDVFLRDIQAATTIRVNLTSGGVQANGGSTAVSINANATYVAFSSFADNLVTGDTNGREDIFVRDLGAGTTVRVNVTNGGAEAIGGGSANPAISADGRYVGFMSYASNLVTVDANGMADVFVHDRQGSTTVLVSIASDNTTQGNFSSDLPVLSSDGSYVAFYSNASNLVTGDSNTRPDIFRAPVP